MTKSIYENEIIKSYKHMKKNDLLEHFAYVKMNATINQVVSEQIIIKLREEIETLKTI